MHVKFNISPRFSIPFISINTKTESADLLQLGRNIERLISKQLIVGQSGAKTVPIPLYQIIRFQTAEKHVVCETIEATYRVKYRIYELTKLLEKDDFIQISSSAIINLNFLANLSASPSGVYQVNFTTGKHSYISRRFMTKLRKELLK